MKQQLHPGAKWLFRFRAYWGFLFLLIFVGWFAIPLMAFFSLIVGVGGGIFIGFLILFILYIAIVIAIAEIYARMAYGRWFYEFTDTNLKIERGIIWKHYSNIPYERIQNVDIHRGILARMLGFSSVAIQTAGFSGGYGGYAHAGAGMAEGSLPAVSMEGAEKIRDFLMEKISKRHGQGL